MSDFDFQLDYNSPVPLYHQIKEEFHKGLLVGQIKLGQRLPPERELCELLGVSRSTIRQALEELNQEGFLIRERSKGTSVAKNIFIQSYQAAVGAFGVSQSIKNQGFTPTIETVNISNSPAPSSIRNLLKLNEKENVLTIERLYRADGQPAVFSTYFIAPDYAEITKLDEIGNTSLYDFFKRNLHIIVFRGERLITATSADKKIAHYLEIKPGSPVLLWTGTDYSKDGNCIGAMLSYFQSGWINIHIMLEHSRPVIALEMIDKMDPE